MTDAAFSVLGQQAQRGVHVGRGGAAVVDFIAQSEVGQEAAGVVDLLHSEPHGLDEVIAMDISVVVWAAQRRRRLKPSEAAVSKIDAEQGV